ncbi:MAG: hypothetical protein ACPL7B_03505 [Candidatus Poribacteria bacterium]
MLRNILTIFLYLFAISTFIYSNFAEAQIVTDGLVSYWTFDKGNVDGTTVKDIIGSNDGAEAKIYLNGNLENSLKAKFAFSGGEVGISIGAHK